MICLRRLAALALAVLLAFDVAEAAAPLVRSERRQAPRPRVVEVSAQGVFVEKRRRGRQLEEEEEEGRGRGRASWEEDEASLSGDGGDADDLPEEEEASGDSLPAVLGISGAAAAGTDSATATSATSPAAQAADGSGAPAASGGAPRTLPALAMPVTEQRQQQPLQQPLTSPASDTQAVGANASASGAAEGHAVSPHNPAPARAFTDGEQPDKDGVASAHVAPSAPRAPLVGQLVGSSVNNTFGVFDDWEPPVAGEPITAVLLAPVRNSLASKSHPHGGLPSGSEAEADVEEIASGLGVSALEPWVPNSRGFSQELRHRMHLQDLATVWVLMFLFAAVLFLSCSSVYQMAEDPSPVLFYSQGKGGAPRAVCSGGDPDAFLQAFNMQPQSIRLRIIGRRTEVRGGLGTLLGSVERRSRFCCPLARPRVRSRVLFDVSLELATFVDAGGGRLPAGDAEALERFLSSENPLETLSLRKKVIWTSWEDIATNIRQRLRSLGFWGDVDVRFEATEELTIYRNHPWANFVRSRVTQVLVAVSLVGGIVWLPYVWARTRKCRAESHFRIDMDPERYWELVVDGLHGIQGFHARPEGNVTHS